MAQTISPDALRTILRRLGPIDALSLRACCKSFFKIVSRDQHYWYCMANPVTSRYHVKRNWSSRCADQSWDSHTSYEERCQNIVERFPLIDPQVLNPPSTFLRQHHLLIAPEYCGRDDHYETFRERCFRDVSDIAEVNSTDEGLWIYHYLFERYNETRKRKKAFRDSNVSATKRLRLLHERQYHRRKVEEIDQKLYWFKHVDELKQLNHKKSVFHRKSAKRFDLHHPILEEG